MNEDAFACVLTSAHGCYCTAFGEVTFTKVSVNDLRFKKIKETAQLSVGDLGYIDILLLKISCVIAVPQFA